jgi:PAS domain S-box-containing protein
VDFRAILEHRDGGVTEPQRVGGDVASALAHLDVMLSSISDFSYLFDRQGRFVYANKALLDLWGLTLEQAAGRNFFDLHYPDDLAAKLQRQIEEVFTTGKRLSDETPYVSPTGVEGFYEYIFVPVVDAAGNVTAVAGTTREITPRKQMEAERERLLRQVGAERQRLAEIIRQAPSFMCVLRGPEHIFELANDRYYDVVGRRDLIGRTVREAFPEIEGQGYFELLDRVYQTGQPYVGSGMRVSLQQEGEQGPDERYIEFVYQPLRDIDGTISGIFVNGLDLTDRKHSEERLARDAHLLANVRDSVIVTDLNGIVTFWNEGATRLFGWQAHEMLGRPMSQRLPEAMRAQTDEWIARIASGDADFDGEWQDYRKDGSAVWIEATTRRIDDAAGKPLGIMGVSRDISERKRNEEMLRENSARFRQLADAMPQIVFSAGPDGHVDYFNRQWYEYTGLPPGEVGYESWRHVHADEGALERVNRVWNESMRTGRPYEIEYRLRRHDGAFRWHLGRALPVRDDQGRIVRWFGTNTDVHDYKLLREQNERLLESERAAHRDADAANRAKDKFLAVLSHELRTPLSPVVMTVAAMEIDPDLPPRLRQDVAMVRRNIELEVKLIDDLLDLSRVTSGKLRLHMQSVHVHEILRHVLESCAADFAAKRLNVHQDLSAANDRTTGDPARLQQVFWNVLRNAIKFTPDGGDIRVRTANAADTSKGHKDELIVEIADSGAGIAPEVLPRVFDAFEQGDARTTRQFGGLGLGLAIVKAVIEMHGGSIRAASEGAGCGATFTMRLGARRAGQRDPHDRAAPTIPAGKLHETSSQRTRILLVEDHPDTARTLARLLQSNGYQVRTANSMVAALQLAAADRFDVLVSDIGLPDGTGYELMEQVRKAHGAGIRGIALSGYGMEEDVKRGKEAGFEEHVVKPVSLAHLDAVIRRVAAIK